MTKNEAVELLLARINSLRSAGGMMFGASDGTTGNFSILVRDTNKAVSEWLETGDTAGLQQMAGTLLAMGNLSGEDYDRVAQALDAPE
ncbi:hypothetical protein EYC59_03375 [Candidatus Saccharibacteria bacterium]|nr:MAG: hypothetical protein EYC59_03375 [Candidatus Saccharibacteria bacterium]